MLPWNMPNAMWHLIHKILREYEPLFSYEFEKVEGTYVNLPDIHYMYKIALPKAPED